MFWRNETNTGKKLAVVLLLVTS